MNLNHQFWQKKRVLITGHTGFKGSWLSLWLQLLGAETLGYALLPSTQPNLFKLAKLEQTMVSVIGDIRDLSTLTKVIRDYQPEIIIHLAAQSLVRQSYINPVETYEVNVMGTVNILEAVRQVASVRAIVNVTSDKCYENKEWVWGYREQDAMGGYDPYSSSKSCAELVTAAYRNSFFAPANYSTHQVAIATGRAGNVIGGGDWSKDRLIPDIIKAWLESKEVLIRNPQAIRPWQYVLEPLNGYLLLAEKLFTEGTAYNGSWNFGPNSSGMQSVSWILEQLKTVWDDEVSWIQVQGDHPHEANVLKLDCSKAIAQLGWYPILDLQTSLSWIVQWVKMWQQGADMRQISQVQIQQFMEKSSSC
jgi:CDP-glucose 4,6-dehydratase